MNPCKDCPRPALDEDCCLHCTQMVAPFWGPPQPRFDPYPVKSISPKPARFCVCGKPAILGAFCSTECADSVVEWGVGAAKEITQHAKTRYEIEPELVGEIDEIVRGG